MSRNFAENLRKAREKAGLSQAEVADAIGVARPTYSNYERGVREPYVPMIQKIAEVLGMTGDELLGLEDLDASRGYYQSRRAAAYAEQMANDPRYQVLFDAVSNVPPEDIDLVRQLIERFIP